jgi:hypothetical protein
MQTTVPFYLKYAVTSGMALAAAMSPTIVISQPDGRWGYALTFQPPREFPRISDLEMINASLDPWIMSESDAEDIANDADADFFPLTPDEAAPLPLRTR